MSFDDTASDPQRSRKTARTDRRALVAVSLAGLLLLLAILACAPGTGFILRVYSTPSGSMAPTLAAGGYALVSRASYGYSRYSFDWISLPISGRLPMVTPQRGDVAVFKLPRDGRTDYLKRVIGLPGDTVQMVKGRLVINGQTVPREPIAKIKTEDFYGKLAEVPTYRETLPEGRNYTILELQGDNGFNDNTRPFTVPRDHYFVLGDNRDNSTDSRVAPEQGGIGFVPLENFVGRVILSF